MHLRRPGQQIGGGGHILKIERGEQVLNIADRRRGLGDDKRALARCHLAFLEVLKRLGLF